MSDKTSKVDVCEKCDGVVMAAMIDKISKSAQKECNKQFNDLCNSGFVVKMEPPEDTRNRHWADSDECISGTCSKEGKKSMNQRVEEMKGKDE